MTRDGVQQPHERRPARLPTFRASVRSPVTTAWRAARWVGRAVAIELDDVPGDLVFFFRRSLAFGVLSFGCVHLLGWWAVSSDGTIGQVLGVGLAMAVAALSLLTLAWVFWQILARPDEPAPYVIATLGSASTVGVSIAAFGSLTTVLAQRGRLATGGEGAPSLLEMEALYLWNLLDSIPVLGVTEALHWDPPVVMLDASGGALVLTFKVLLLVPLVRVLVAGLHQLVSTLTSMAGRAPNLAGLREGSQWPAKRSFRALLVVMIAVGVVLWTVTSWAVLELVVRRSSVADVWLSSVVPARIDVAGASISTSWWPVALDIVGAWVVASMAWAVADPIADSEVFAGAHSGLSAVALGAMLVWLFVLATMAASAVALVLLHVGAAHASTDMTAAGEVGTTLEWFSWHLVDALPLLDVTSTLHWTLDGDYTDRWTGLVLVAMRCVMVLVLFLPFLFFRRLLIRANERSRPVSGVEAELEAQIAWVQQTLDAAEVRLRADADRRFASSGSALRDAFGSIRRLDRSQQQLQGRFNEQTQQAMSQVIRALEARAGALSSAEIDLTMLRGSERVKKALAPLSPARATAEEARQRCLVRLDAERRRFHLPAADEPPP